MEFDKSKVYTALNADELKPGSKVICANYLESLKTQVQANSYPSYVVELSQIMGTSSTNRFGVGDETFNLAYLVSEPEEKDWIVYLSRKPSNSEDYYITSCRSDRWEEVKEKYGAKTKLFEGTEDEAEKWYTSRRYFANVIAAWEDGKAIQFKYDDCWIEAPNPEWNINIVYRIKPEGLKWTDLKIGDIIRNESSTHTIMVVGIDYRKESKCHIFIGEMWLDDDDLNYWEKVE